ncbi:MAG TPA: hypothetical protein VK864_16990 [Longimicrobiales bacterium]|nr:hypothetical protein [Longimicrobiales bacterium]
MRPPHLQLHIQELVLEGIDPADRAGLVSAFEHELHQLLASTNVLEHIVQAGNRNRISGDLPAANDAAGQGRAAARALASNLAAQPATRGPTP